MPGVKSLDLSPSPYDLYCVGGTLSLTQSVNQPLSSYSIFAAETLRYAVTLTFDFEDLSYAGCAMVNICMCCLVWGFRKQNFTLRLHFPQKQIFGQFLTGLIKLRQKGLNNGDTLK